MVTFKNQYINRVQQLGPSYDPYDGVGLAVLNSFSFTDCIIDFSQYDGDDLDEACSVTWGASTTFERCVIRGASKLFLCGSGDADKADLEADKHVVLKECILENFGRRGPEAQCMMMVTLEDCLIRNWGDPDYFDVRNFACWAHDDATIIANRCVFWQDRFWRPLGQMIRDLANHIGQAWNDFGPLALFCPSTYRPGVCRGLTTSDGGSVAAIECYKNHWWISLENRDGVMDGLGAEILMARLESMRRELEERLK